MSEHSARDSHRENDRSGERRNHSGSRGRTGSGEGRSYSKRDGSRDPRDNRGRRNDRTDRRDRDDRNKRGARDADRSNPRRGRFEEEEEQGRNSKHFRSAPRRQGYREERMERKENDPDLPEDLDVAELDPLVWQDLRVLSKGNAEAVGKHLLMAADLIDDSPELALAHARAAKGRAGRVAVAREMNGVAAYRNGEWKEALAELRAARRIGGGPGLMALMADCERGLGRPQKAIELGRSEEARQLDQEARIELAIVIAGARQDLEQHDAAVLTLERLNPDSDGSGMSAVRLAYAYANALALAGRTEEAKEWFAHTVEMDREELTDAAERLTELG